jgi:hypothetical protein
VLLVLALAPPNVLGVDLFSEDFEDLTLMPVVTFDSEIREREAWTDIPPGGWTIDNSMVSTVNDPNQGVLEFEGWRFVNKEWWINTAGDQDRSQFFGGRGIVAVADPDEWDDFPAVSGVPSPDDIGPFDARLTTPSISLSGVGENQAKVFFHSSWRPEDTQRASLTAHYTGGGNPSVEILRWESNPGPDENPNPLFKPDAANEALTYNLMNPQGASSVRLEFRLFDATNDWWWAFDNLQVFTGDAPASDAVLRAVIDRDTGEVSILNQTDDPVSLRGYSLRSGAGVFDEQGATFLSDSNSNWLRATQFGDAVNDLSEVYLLDGFALAAGSAIDFGAGAWQQFFRDVGDISFNYLTAGSDDPIQGIVQFIGNEDTSFDFLDLNYSGEVEIGDWEAFKAGFGENLTGLNEVQRHNLGDLDNDGLHTAGDFAEFLRLYDQSNGQGAFAAMLAGVPEPGSALLSFMAIGGLLVSRIRPRARWQVNVLTIAIVCGVALIADQAQAQLTLLAEDFEGLDLGSNVEEGLSGSEVWTNEPPPGWSIDNDGMPGIGDPDTDGVVEWAGWSFASKEWWVAAAGDQDRGLFSRGQGTVMIADPDEWDDADGAARAAIMPIDLYDTFASTPVINIPANIPAGRIKLSFDSSWRPEGMDDLDQSNNQTGTISVRYNGGPQNEVLRWDSDPESNTFHPYAVNERITNLDLEYNGTDTTLQLTFGLGQAWNDWWWAVDNVLIAVPADPSIVRIDTVTGRGYLVGGDVIPAPINFIDLTSANGVLRGDTVTGLSGANPNQVDGPDPMNNAGDSPGEQWEMLTASDGRITEAFLFGDTTFNESLTVPLGVIFDSATPMEMRDVQFSYTNSFGDFITGVVEYFESAAVPGDYNNDGVVNAADYVVFRNHEGMNFALPNRNPALMGPIGAGDYNYWKARFGNTAGNGTAFAVPEPGTLAALCALAMAVCGLRWSDRVRLLALLLGIVWAHSLSGAAEAATLDRLYLFGDASGEGAVVGQDVGSGSSNGATFDSEGQPMMNQLIDLVPKAPLFVKPKYVAITDRPDGVGGKGIQLNPFGIEEQHLHTGFEEALNFPERSPSSTFAVPPGTIDYSLISDRGFQLWVKPTIVKHSHIVMDSNQHGVLITADGKFAMRYAWTPETNFDYVSDFPVVANQWYHLSVVRPFGPNNGSILYVDGVAEAAATGTYAIEKVVNAEGVIIDPAANDSSPLVIGASTARDVFGTNFHFSGIVDDLEMFVMGINHTRDFGEYVFQNDNDYAAFFKPDTQGDLTGDNMVTLADAQEFASNWLFENRLVWTNAGGNQQSLVVGDLASRDRGDFNYDGRVNLADWAILQNQSPAAAAAAMRIIQGVVPEPTSALLVLLAASAICLRLRLPNLDRFPGQR